jgi:hypothetical protein
MGKHHAHILNRHPAAPEIAAAGSDGNDDD